MVCAEPETSSSPPRPRSASADAITGSMRYRRGIARAAGDKETQELNDPSGVDERGDGGRHVVCVQSRNIDVVEQALEKAKAGATTGGLQGRR